jgi:hypothetical protein
MPFPKNILPPQEALPAQSHTGREGDCAACGERPGVILTPAVRLICEECAEAGVDGVELEPSSA